MKFGEKLQTNILVTLSLIWIIALFLAYLPTYQLGTPTFPFSVDYQSKIIFFNTSTGLISVAFFMKGFSLMRKPS